MSSSVEARAAAAWLALLLAAGTASAQALPYAGIGRDATAAELTAWDIDVRPDFKGLPPGSGSVAQGQEVWEGKCASCHGVFGESNEVFTPLVGGTTRDDVRTGRAARLTDTAYPARTTLMKVSTLSTLWDYIRRAMPWTAPKTLTTDEVYAVTAYLLNLGEVVPDHYVLSERTMAEAQQRLPNRLGATTAHGLWPGRGLGNGGRPDVQARACMKDCVAGTAVASLLPDFARNAHGNLAEQNRMVGAQHGADTTQPPAPLGSLRPAAAPSAVPAGDPAAAAAQALTRQHNCVACHGVESKIIGPAFADVARKYASRSDALAYLAGKIRSGGTGLWGTLAMPAQTLPEAELRVIAQWLADGARK
jgi:cytochrome c